MCRWLRRDETFFTQTIYGLQGCGDVADALQQNDNGLNLRNTDAIDYMRWMQQTAAALGMKIGLKKQLGHPRDTLPDNGLCRE